MISTVAMGVPYIPGTGELRSFAAELCLVGGIVANLLIPFFSRKPNASCAGVSLLVVVLAALLVPTGAISGAVALPGAATDHFSGFLTNDSLGNFWRITLLLFVAGVIVLWTGHSGRTLREGDAPEFFCLLLGATLGMSLMASTTNLLMIFMSVALASLPSYLLSGFRKASRRGAEASLKYVLFGAVTAAVLAYGMSFVYGVFGTLQLSAFVNHPEAASVLAIATAAMLVGVGFKVAAVPVHLWCPDVFDGAQLEVTAFLSVASKGAGLVLLLRVLQATGPAPSLTIVVGLIGAVTATVGNAGALAQTGMKRLLAYSSIAQSGYMLCVVALMTTLTASDGSPATTAGTGTLSAATVSASTVNAGATAGTVLLYLLIYAVMNLGAFAVTAAVIRQTTSDAVEQFRGLSRSAPVLAACMLCCLVSLIGLPPLAGFGAKVFVLWVLARSGPFGLFLVAVVVVNTVVSAFYYFRVVGAMYLRPAVPSHSPHRFRDPVCTSVAVVCAVTLFAFFFLISPLYNRAMEPLSDGKPQLRSASHRY